MTNYKYKIGDRVFAKVKGYSPWPAVVKSLDDTAKLPKYRVVFYGTKEAALVREVDLCLFMENKSRLGNLKSKVFMAAMKEANMSLSLTKSQSSSMNSLNNTPKLNCSTTSSIAFPSATSSPIEPLANVLDKNSECDRKEITSLEAKLFEAQREIIELNKRLKSFHDDSFLKQHPNDNPRVLNERLLTCIHCYKDDILNLNKQKQSLIEENEVLTNKLLELSQQSSTEQKNLQIDEIINPDKNSKNVAMSVNSISNRINITRSILNNDWLTDDSVTCYYQLLSSNLEMKVKTVFLNPIIAQAIKCLDDNNYILEGLDLSEQSYILIPVNDSPAVDKAGGSGSHWSLLLYVKNKDMFLYFDSAGSMNYKHAEVIAKRLQTKLGSNPDKPVKIISTPQQENSFDCGVYLILFTEIIAQFILNEKPIETLEHHFPKVKISEVIKKRSQLAMFYYNTKTCVSKQTFQDLMIKVQFVHEEYSPNIITSYNWTTVESHKNKVCSPLSYNKSGQNKVSGQVKGHKKNIVSQERTSIVPCENRYKIFTAVEKEMEDSVEEEEKEGNKSVISRQANGQLKMQRKKGCYLQKENTWNQKEAASPEKDKQNQVLILGDSHGRGLTQTISARLGSKFKVMSIIKPNAVFDDVVMDIENLCSSFNKNDYVVIIAGTNDFNHSDGSLKLNLDKINRIADRTNIVIPGIPLRFDKVGFKVNSLILEYNLNLFKTIDSLKKDNKNFVDVPKKTFSLNDHTTHGLHLNKYGKLKISNQIALSIFRHMKNNIYPINKISTQHTPTSTRDTIQPMLDTGYSHLVSHNEAHSLTQPYTSSLVPNPPHAIELNCQPEPLIPSLNSATDIISITT